MISVLKFTKKYNFVTNVDGVTVLVPCVSSEDATYFYQFSLLSGHDFYGEIFKGA